jgi:hypothetical protein
MIKSLKLYDPLLQKVRLGDPCDGGYVVALQMITRSTNCYSYGVGTNISFEKDYADATGNPVYCFDHTIENIHIDEKYKFNIVYTKQGLSATKTDVTDNFLQHYENNNTSGRVLFKADIEGSEYEYILNTDIKKLASITTGLVFEFHYLQSSENQTKFFECVNKLNEYYYLCHVHGNNFANNFVYEEIQPNTNYIKQYSVPEVIELTFINKDLVTNQVYDNKLYPCSFLDRRNDSLKQDLDLGFLRLI